MNFRCQKLTSFDTGVTYFIGQNVISETIPVTLKRVKFIGFISNQIITITLVGKSAFELVHLCKGSLLVPFAQRAEFRNVFKTICSWPCNIVKIKCTKNTYSLFEDIYSY